MPNPNGKWVVLAARKIIKEASCSPGMKIFLITALLFTSLFSVVEASEWSLTEKDSSREVSLKKGDRLLVQLAANPTTGYSWNLQIMGDNILSQGKSQYKPSDKSGNLVGSGGTEIWKFRAQHPGSTRLDFSYARPWEKGVFPVRILHFPVTVKL
jgi:inhibitor of cysteine peptidase